MTAAELWRCRRRERPLSGAWVLRAAKRCLTLPTFLGSEWRKAWLRRRGAAIARTAVLMPLTAGGRHRHLTIGERSFVGRARLTLHERVTIGAYVTINDDVRLMTASHDVRSDGWKMVSRPIVIEDYAWVAEGAVILPGVKIGRGAVVGAFSVVRHDVPAGQLATGNPETLFDLQRYGPFDYDPTHGPAFVEAWLGR